MDRNHQLDLRRPVLRAGVHATPTSEGIALEGPSELRITLQGPEVRDVLVWLVSQFDGVTGANEIVARLDEDRRPLAERIIAALDRYGIIRDRARDRSHSLTAHELVCHAGEIAQIAQHRESPEQRFDDFRSTPMVLIGPVHAVSPMVRLALDSGLRRLRVLVPGGISGEPGDLARCADVKIIEAGASGIEAIRPLIAEFPVVVHVSTAHSADFLRRLDRLCWEEQKYLVPAVVLGDRAWIGPVGLPGNEWTRWAAFWQRHRNTLPERARHSDPTLVQLELVASHLLLLCFRRITGIEQATAPDVVHLEFAQLRSTKRIIAPHPHGLPRSPETSTEVAAKIGALCDAEPLLERDFYRSIRRYIDAQVGIFADIRAAGTGPLPLQVAEVVVTDPLKSYRAQHVPVIVRGAGPDMLRARLDALRRACELYAYLMVDPQRLHTADAAPAFLESMPDEWAAGRLWGVSLGTGQWRTVRAGDVFPHLVSGPTATAPVGVASGNTFCEAVERALIDQCASHTIASPETEESPLDLWSLELRGIGSHYRNLLRLSGETVHAVRFTHELAPPVVRLSNSTVGDLYSTGRTLGEAIGHGIEQLLLHRQWQRLSPPESPCPPMGHRIGQPAPGPRASGTTTLGRHLIDRLTRRGLHPVVVTLDHDPVLSRLHPFLVRVLVLPDPAEGHGTCW